jgi:hypothetical protein
MIPQQQASSRSRSPSRRSNKARHVRPPSLVHFFDDPLLARCTTATADLLLLADNSGGKEEEKLYKEGVGEAKEDNRCAILVLATNYLSHILLRWKWYRVVSSESSSELWTLSKQSSCGVKFSMVRNEISVAFRPSLSMCLFAKYLAKSASVPICSSL